MKRVEFLLITLMGICVFTFLSACGKSDKSAGDPAINPAVTYAYNQRPCSEEIIYDYEQVVRACESRSRRDSYRDRDNRDRRERRHCQALGEAFLAQYPQINCMIEVRAGYSSRYKQKTISEEQVRRKMDN